LGLEQASYWKILGVLVCFAGAISTGLNDDNNNTNQTVVGDILAILGAVGYGSYTASIRYFIPDEEAVSMHLVLGYIGLVNALLLLPCLLILVSFFIIFLPTFFESFCYLLFTLFLVYA
jgi:solute carrier family 35, member F5